MSDRYNGFIVTLEEDTKDEDAEEIINAIEMIKGVLMAKPNIANVNSHIAESRVRLEFGKKLLNIVFPIKEEK